MGEFSRDFLAIFPSEGNITLSEGLVIFTAQLLDIQLKFANITGKLHFKRSRINVA